MKPQNVIIFRWSLAAYASVWKSAAEVASLMAQRFLRWLCATKPPSPDFPFPVYNLVLMMCAIFGVAFMLGGGKQWWMEQFYEAEGVRTESGLMIGKRTVTREGAEGGTITEHLVRYRFHDQFDRAQEFEVKAEQLRLQSSESVVGTCLPMIEYLASDPKVHRFASEKGSGRKFFWFGVYLLVAIIPIRLIYGIAMRLFGHEWRPMI